MDNFAQYAKDATKKKDDDVDCGHSGPGPGHVCVRCGGKLSITLVDEGVAWIDYVFLQPGPWGRFKGLNVSAGYEYSCCSETRTLPG